MRSIIILLSFLFALPAVAQMRQLTADAVVYVNCARGSDSNDGSTPALAFKNAQSAADYVWSHFDVNGWSVTFQYADGDQRPCLGGGATVNGLVRGQAMPNRNILTPYSEGVIRFRGNPSNTTAVIIQGMNASNGASIFVDDVRILASYNGLISDRGSDVFFRNVTFSLSGNAHMAAMNGGRIANYGSYAIEGGAAVHMAASVGSSIIIGGFPVVIYNGPYFSSAFATVQMNATIVSQGIWSGVVNAVQYLVQFNGVLYGASTIPGSSPGYVGQGGQLGG